MASTSSIDDQLGIVASDGTQRNEKKNLNNDTVEFTKREVHVLKFCKHMQGSWIGMLKHKVPRRL